MIVLIDNYGSFVHNLARYVERLGTESRVVRNDAIVVAGLRKLRPCAIILSPGPCTPAEAGCSLDIVRGLHTEVPILGICEGHQAIGEALGGKVVRSPVPVHGRTSRVGHDVSGVFAGLPNPLTVCRYHSLSVEEANAWLARRDYHADVESPALLASLYALLEGQEAVAASEAAGFAL